MIRYYPSKVIIADKPAVRESVITKNILSKISGRQIPVIYLDETSIKEVIEETGQQPDPFNTGKKTLLITENRGGFLKKCPGTNEYICCNYYIIDFAQNCPMDCTYCILQAYLNNPLMVVYSNTDDMFAELEKRLAEEKNGPLRIGTGEFTDSLALEHLTGYSGLIMDFFEKRPEVLIEFKTKTDYAETFLNRKPSENVLLSWSMNAQNVARNEEHKTASIAERLDAAKKCAQAGYKITLHFDPIIDYEDFDMQMAKTVKLIFDNLAAGSIKYISLGCFRYIPKLKETIASRFPASKIIYNEFIKGYDGKTRYFRFKRERLFEKLIKLIKKYDTEGKIRIYFCMESQEMWKKLLGGAPACDEELGERLYGCCYKNNSGADNIKL